MTDAAGTLRMVIAKRGDGQSFARSQFHEKALRIIRPHYLDDSGQVTYTIVNPGGAYFGADRYDIDVTVEDDASLLLTTQSATKVYKTPQGPARQDMVVRVGENATFEYLPDQLIVYREGTYRQSTVVEVMPTSRVAMAEIVTPGWSPEGTSFSFDELRMRTEVRLRTATGTVPFAVDNLRLIPRTNALGLGVMEGFTHSGQLLLIGPGIEAAYPLLTELIDASSTHSAISRIGVPWRSERIGAPAPIAFSIRSLADSTQAIERLQLDAVAAVRAADGDRGPVNLRKH